MAVARRVISPGPHAIFDPSHASRFHSRCELGFVHDCRLHGVPETIPNGTAFPENGVLEFRGFPNCISGLHGRRLDRNHDGTAPDLAAANHPVSDLAAERAASQ